MTKAAVKENAEAPLFGDPKLKSEPKAVALRTTKEPAIVAPMNMLAVLANAASDPKCEPAKMRELYAIHKEMAQDQAKIEFVHDFAALQDENLHINAKGKIIIPAKDGKIGQETPYAKFNDINKAIKPLLQKHGFTLSFETEPSTDASRLIVKGILAHKGGHQRTTAFPLPVENSGSKNNVQGWGSSMSYGKRYCTIALLNLTSEAMEDRDNDGAGKTGVSGSDSKPACLSIEQSAPLVALIKESVGLDRFLEKYKLKAVIDLDPALYAEAVKACKNFAAAKAAKKAKA
jgi:hypothetical protein